MRRVGLVGVKRDWWWYPDYYSVGLSGGRSVGLSDEEDASE
jgi:hypothetical protein